MSGAVATEVNRKLIAAAGRDVEELLPHLHERAKVVAARAEKLLADRGEREAREMRELLESQRARIEAVRKRRDDPAQLALFDSEERRQLESDRRHWEQRLGEIEQQIEREPERIRASYAVKAPRVEPVGLVYLWPVSG